jgi:hypothetical protein
MVGVWLLATIIAAYHRAPQSREWRGPVPALIAVAVGALAFVPWLPVFFYQSKHTGTPWAAPANFAGIVNAVTGFTFNQGSLSPVSSNQGRLLSLIYLALAALALFGVGRSGRIVELDLRTRPRTRGMTFVVVATLFAAIAGGILDGSAFSSRYASVVFLPFLLLVAVGSATLLNRNARLILLTPERALPAHPGQGGGCGDRRSRPPGRRDRLLPGPAGPGHLPGGERPVAVQDDHLPAGDRAPVHRLGRLRPGLEGREPGRLRL